MISVLNKYKCGKVPNQIYIGRGSVLGNPFTHLELEDTKASFKCETREDSINKFEEYLINKIKEKDPQICSELNKIYLMSLKGEVNLICFCKPKSCHGDIIKKIIDQKL